MEERELIQVNLRFPAAALEGLSRLADSLRALAERLAREIDPAATIHDFRRGGEGEVSFDVVVPYDVALSDRQVREALAEKLARREPDCRPSIGVDRSHVL